MAKKTKIGGIRSGLDTPDRRWRRTRIKDWREAQEPKVTQQAVADYLASLKPPILLDRVSIGRIESGDQMPSAEVLEAMAALFGTDVDSMLNLTPDEGAVVRAFKELDPKDRKRLLRVYEATKDDEP